MKNSVSNFTRLHHQATPLILANVWDVGSAKIAEKSGFQAIGTSSAAIATALGYDDGEQLSFDELLYIVGRIRANTQLPLSVDLESGYSHDSQKILSYIQQLIALGVAGINLEDSRCQPDRALLNCPDFAELLAEIKATTGDSLFINARTDAFLLGLPNALEETLYRLEHYEKSGIDGLFVPCAVDLQDIKTICQATDLPVNIMCMPDLPDFQALATAGVKRLSMGNFVYEKLQQQLGDTLQQIIAQQSFNSVFER